MAATLLAGLTAGVLLLLAGLLPAALLLTGLVATLILLALILLTLVVLVLVRHLGPPVERELKCLKRHLVPLEPEIVIGAVAA